MPRHSNYEDFSKIPLQEFHDTGVSSFFRVLSNNLNHQNILADNKANIMIYINMVVLSLVIGSSARNTEYWQNLFVPIIMFVSTSLLAIVFAILATRPNFVKGIVTQDDLDNKKSNLFFFGNFTSLTAQDFEDTMLTILKDDDYLYRSLLGDFYGQGIVLKRKYRLLKYSYNIFLIGLVLSTIVFGFFQYFNLN
ncbi:MAG: hypothetical protein EBZ58_04620 [Bacteroidetes bacterium]|nr:hypothetical protein [Bacteroidota bacterium]